MTWYEEWFGTRYYKLLYGNRDIDDAQPWVRSILHKCGTAKGSAVLDMACGRGRHAYWFAQEGMDVHGIDISEASIAEARTAVPDAHFDVHDMRRPYRTDAFHLAVCLFSSLGYSEHTEDDQCILATAADALHNDGMFVLDLMNEARIRSELVPEERLERGGAVFRIEREVKDGRIEKRIHVQEAGEEHHYLERVRLYPGEAIEAMAEKVGLEVIEWTDGPEMTPFDPERSFRAVLWAKRKHR